MGSVDQIMSLGVGSNFTIRGKRYMIERDTGWTFGSAPDGVQTLSIPVRLSSGRITRITIRDDSAVSDVKQTLRDHEERIF